MKKQVIKLHIRNNKYMPGIKTLLLVLLLWVIACPGTIKAQTNIKIHPSTVNKIGGYAEVQELFGVMVTGGNPAVAEYLEEANVTGVRNIIKVVNPGDLDFKFPPWTIDKQENKRFETKARAEAWFDEFISRDPEPLWSQQLKPVDVYFDGRFGNANVTICGNPRVFDARMERNLEASKNHVIAYLNAVKQIEQEEGGAAFKYFQLSNEPEQGRNWTGYFDVEPMPVINEDRDMDSLYLSKDQRMGSKSYTRVFNYLYDEISTRFPDITFVGNCIGHDGAYRLDAPGKKPHMNWNTWVKYYIDHIRNPEALEYFNVQTYRVPTLRNLAYVSMTQSYAEMKRGVRPRYFISETNAPAGGDKNYLNQFIFNSSEIMTMLENPDKYSVRQGYIATPGDNYNYFYYKNNQLHPRSSYHVLDILKHVRGTNVYYETDNNVIKVFASAPDENRIVLALFNPGGSEQEINIHPGLPAAKIEKIKQRKAVWSQSALNTVISTNLLSIQSPLQMTLEPLSLHAIEINLKDKLALNKVSRSREYYGDTIQASLSAPLSYDIEVRDLPDDNLNAFLRIAFKKKPGPGHYTINLNGNNYNYDLGELPDKKIETWHDMVGFIEIPVNPDHLSSNNQITIGELDGNILLYSSIILTNLPYTHKN